MDKNTLHSSTGHQDHNDTFTNQNTNSELPPPYSPIQQHHPSSSSQQDNLPNDHSSSTSDTQPSASSLYPEIPQRSPPSGPKIVFPVPQPYNHHSQQKHHANAHVSTPLYHQPAHHNTGYQQQPYYQGRPDVLYGSTHHAPHSPAPPTGFHTIYVPGHQHQHHPTQPSPPSIDSNRRRSFPVGALIFIFGWAFPPFWILGFCCLVSRNPYEVWWARVNLLMALLLLLSSIIYSMFAILAGDWYVGLQWIALPQEI